MRFDFTICWPIVCLTGFLPVCGVEVAADTPDTFLESYCVDCHSGDQAEGHFDVTGFTRPSHDIESVRKWAQVLDRVSAKEMPPIDATQPEAAEIETWLKVTKPLVIEADRRVRKTVLRRLNRREYEHTLHDLLSLDIPLTEYLPEDRLAAGFDTNGDALAVSTEQLQAYIQAAEVAINEAIMTGERPETETVTVDSFKEIKPYVGKNYDIVDGRAAVFSASKQTYSKISTREYRVKTRGRYRFSFELAAVNSDEPMAVLVSAEEKSFYLDALKDAKRYTLEAILSPGSAVQFHLVDRPTYVRDPVVNKEPGMAVGPVTITGPIYESWPHASHVNLIGDVDLSKATTGEARLILSRFMPRAFRRPVDAAEVDRYVNLVDDRLQAGRNFEEAIKVALISVLCSPNFLYLEEPSHETGAEISDVALANRMSYFLWSSQPDPGLMASAIEGKVSTKQGLHSAIERLLSDAKSERFVESFTDHWLHLRRINETTPDTKLFPEFDAYLKYSMVEECRAFFRRALQDDRSIFEFLDSDDAMLNQRLARHYGIDGVVGTRFRPVPLPEASVRGGVLTQGAVLKVTANGTNTSPVVRGVWVLENILGKHLPPPPANVPALEPDLRGTTTVRERLEKHKADESCQSCHRFIDPPGFALESFDPVGSYRTHYIQFQVNPEFQKEGWGTFVSGPQVESAGVTVSGESFDNINDFRELLLNQREAFARCLTEKLLTYALGRELGISDRDEVDRIAAEVVEMNYGLRTLIHQIVQSSTFVRS